MNFTKGQTYQFREIGLGPFDHLIPNGEFTVLSKPFIAKYKNDKYDISPGDEIMYIDVLHGTHNLGKRLIKTSSAANWVWSANAHTKSPYNDNSEWLF